MSTVCASESPESAHPVLKRYGGVCHSSNVSQFKCGGNSCGETFAHLGAFWAAENEPELAIIFYKFAINIYEAIRRESQSRPGVGALGDPDRLFLHEHAADYRTLARLLLEQDRVLEA